MPNWPAPLATLKVWVSPVSTSVSVMVPVVGVVWVTLSTGSSLVPKTPILRV